MYDCRTQGGHFFVCQPTHPTLQCHHCSEKMLRSYRCILEKCGYLACESCSTSINASLDEFHKSRELAKASGLPLPSPPSCHSPPTVPAFARDGDGDHDDGAVGRPRRGTVESVVGAISSTSLGEPGASGDGDSALGVGVIEVDDDVQDEDYAPPKRPFTRSAAMAAAFATTRQLSGRPRARNSIFRPRTGEGEGGG